MTLRYPANSELKSILQNICQVHGLRLPHCTNAARGATWINTSSLAGKNWDSQRVTNGRIANRIAHSETAGQKSRPEFFVR